MSILKKYIKPEMFEDIEKEIKTKISESIQIQADISKLWGDDGNTVPDYEVQKPLGDKNQKVLREIYVLDAVINEFKQTNDFVHVPYMKTIKFYQERYEVPLTEYQTKYMDNYINNAGGN